MSRKEEIRNKSDELGQKYFPNANNIWARPNIEAQCVSSACMEIAQWVDKTMIDKACEWLLKGGYFVNSNETIEDFRKAMEE